jgi:hypothetical protein
MKEDAKNQMNKPTKSLTEITKTESVKQRRKRYTQHLTYLMRSKKE